MTTTDALAVAERYRQEFDSLTEKERATRERAIWAMAKDSHRGEDRFIALGKITGQDPYSLRNRSDILAAGDCAEPLWVRIHNKEMLLKVGRQLVITARKDTLEKRGTKSMEAAILDALKAYDALPHVRVQDGIPFRVNGPRAKGEPEKVKFMQFNQSQDREFWITFRATLSGYFEKKCEGLDPSTVELLKRGFETDLKVATEQFLANVRRVQAREKSHAEVALIAITRNKILEACTTLHMDPPSVGKPVDLEKARRQKKVLARAYHPDANGGDESLRSKYIAVMDAFQILEAYTEQINDTNTQPTGTANNNDHQD